LFSFRGEKSPSSSKGVGSVIVCFGLEGYSEFEILENMSLGGGCREIPEPP